MPGSQSDSASLQLLGAGRVTGATGRLTATTGPIRQVDVVRAGVGLYIIGVTSTLVFPSSNLILTVCPCNPTSTPQGVKVDVVVGPGSAQVLTYRGDTGAAVDIDFMFKFEVILPTT